ncbi:MAG: signal recognition particle protein Srp54 [Nanoarchaeota archaeon]|nr:signal recognition particle protein Srp54 [Nanoarchaeota archaeon]
MVLTKLSNSLKNTLTKVAKCIFVDEKLINELIRDIQRALLQADVNVKLVFELSNNIKKRALEEKAPAAITQKEHLIKIVYEELIKFLGGERNTIKISKKPFKILLVGLFGSGKTTQAGKLANFFKKRGNKVALVQTDTWRPAAYKQLKTLGEQINVSVFGDEKEKNPTKIYKNFKSQINNFDLVIIDSAGRDALNKELISEIEGLNKLIQPDETILVLSADIGQAAQKQSEQFHKSCGVKGIIVTKMDGTAKGGGAISACAVTNAPIKFLGLGEKINDLEEFNPKGFVGRILGMGDIGALLEKAKDAIDADKAEDISRKMLQGDFNFLDLFEQMKALSKMGSLSKIMNLIPGMGNMNLPKNIIEGQEEKIEVWKHIMQSMTKKELEDPSIISRNRIERIAKGAGVPVKEVRGLLKQYKLSKKMLKALKGTKDPQKMMSKFKGKIPSLK